MRPYNGVQKLGLALLLAGIALDLVYFAGRLGWISPLTRSSLPVVALVLPGLLLVNSRRQAVPDLAPELAAARKRWLIIVTTVCVAVLGLATAIELSGA